MSYVMKGDKLMTAPDELLREAAQLVVDDAWYREGEEVSTLPTRNLIRLKAALAATSPASAPDALLREALRKVESRDGGTLALRLGTLMKAVRDHLDATPPASAAVHINAGQGEATAMAWSEGHTEGFEEGAALLREAVSTLENYGDHHEWCVRGDACNCGFTAQLANLLTATPPAGAEREHDLWAKHAGTYCKVCEEEQAWQSATPPASAPYEHTHHGPYRGCDWINTGVHTGCEFATPPASAVGHVNRSNLMWTVCDACVRGDHSVHLEAVIDECAADGCNCMVATPPASAERDAVVEAAIGIAREHLVLNPQNDWATGYTKAASSILARLENLRAAEARDRG